MDHAAVRGVENRPRAAMHGFAPLRPDDALLPDLSLIHILSVIKYLRQILLLNCLSIPAYLY